MRAQLRKYIDDLSDKVRKACGFDDNRFPVDLELCVANIGGDMVRAERRPQSIIEKVGSESFRVSVWQGMSPSKDRMCVAHELGHLFLHMGFCVDEDNWNAFSAGQEDPKRLFGYMDIDYEARSFGLAFLIPRYALEHEVWKQQGGGRVDLKPIAAHFGVAADDVREQGQWLGVFYRDFWPWLSTLVAVPWTTASVDGHAS